MKIRKLNVFPREKDITANQLRRQGYIPAIYYGENQIPKKITANKKEINAMIARIGGNALYEIAMENEVRQAVIKEIQKDPVTKEIIHVDFQEMSDKKKAGLHVPLKYEGIKELELKGIILQRQVEAINVEGYVNSIPSYISVYVGNMKQGQSIFIGDLKIGDDIQVLEPKEKLIAVAISAAK